MLYYIVEHPTRGTLRDLEDRNGGYRGTFSITGSRNDPDRTMRFPTVEAAVRAVRGLEGNRGDGCQVRASEGREKGMAAWASSWPACWPVDRRA